MLSRPGLTIPFALMATLAVLAAGCGADADRAQKTGETSTRRPAAPQPPNAADGGPVAAKVADPPDAVTLENVEVREVVAHT